MTISKRDQENLDALKRFDDYEWFVQVVRLSEGQSFGELALINDDPRAANVVSLTECYFAVLTKGEYEKVLKRIENKAILVKIGFFQ